MHDNASMLLLTIDDVLRLTGYKSRSSIYRRMRHRDFPQPVVLGGGRIRWRSSEIEQWLRGLPTQTYS
ncbi:helix-turn-helix transcriptional regulator [Acidocella sp.]|uniref:helix-turn-helix transcriptional regulator n=1 Tax=Acidocella sp. TaxID=50710 RepID=UPI00345DC7C2